MNTRAKDGRAQGRHAVVLGGSLAGLLAARVLADHFEEVTLIERDAYPDTTEAARESRRLITSMDCWREAARFSKNFFPACRKR